MASFDQAFGVALDALEAEFGTTRGRTTLSPARRERLMAVYLRVKTIACRFRDIITENVLRNRFTDHVEWIEVAVALNNLGAHINRGFLARGIVLHDWPIVELT